MSKSVLVIDTPENCLDCQFCYELDEGVEACCSISDDDKDTSIMKKIDCEYGYCQGKPDWCPLMDLPEKDDFDDLYDEYYTGYHDGWNRCLKEITSQGKDN
ncbi:MAG: hypothetical protein BHW52_03310 [Ruminococcus sp. 37_24]|jgi:hypothetical protein|nr:MAG: hypothetical protein BHW52_03310 [Ruminococcus sp. 37_24]